MRGEQIVGVAAAVIVGAGAGAGIRLLLGRLRRGVLVRAGPTEVAGGIVTGVGVATAWGQASIGLVLTAGLLMVALTGVDVVHHRLPDAITLPALPIVALVICGTQLVAPASGSLITAALSAVVLFAVFATTARISSAWMGRGDVKLIPTLGLMMGYLSTGAVLIGLVVAFGLGSLVALAGMATQRLTLRSAIPLGPYLLFGCWSVLLFPALVT